MILCQKVYVILALCVSCDSCRGYILAQMYLLYNTGGSKRKNPQGFLKPVRRHPITDLDSRYNRFRYRPIYSYAAGQHAVLFTLLQATIKLETKNYLYFQNTIYEWKISKQHFCVRTFLCYSAISYDPHCFVLSQLNFCKNC